MLAINHALTGALVGLTLENPALAVPVAFMSHFALDAIPHFDPPGSEVHRISSKQFKLQLVVDGSACGLLVLALSLTKPQHWLTAAFCAFAAASPDLMWIPKFVQAQKTGQTGPNKFWLLRFHSWVQWRTGPRLILLEAVWFVAVIGILVTQF